MQNLESWQARDVLAVFERMNARPGFRLSVQALWHSIGRGQVVKAGVDWLVSADYVEISADKTSIILKEAGYNIISGRDPGPIPVPSVTARPARRAIILTALDVETSAVLRRIANREEVVVRGTVFYSGNFEDWDLAVAEVGSGNSPAAVIAERAIQHFDPQVALFVGVAGGIKDVEIGDVVVATKVYGYERGKDDEGGFKPRPDVQVSAHGLEQRGRAIRQKSSWKSRLDPGLASSAARIYVGPMAAGEKVVASTRAPIAQFLREYYSDALAVEMEGRGFLEGVHLTAPVQGCVIRGISDLLSGKTAADTQGFQQHAADAASAVAFEILATLHDLETHRVQSSAAVSREKRGESASAAREGASVRPSFKETPTTVSAAVYFKPGEPLAAFGEEHDKVEFFYPSANAFYGSSWNRVGEFRV